MTSSGFIVGSSLPVQHLNKLCACYEMSSYHCQQTTFSSWCPAPCLANVVERADGYWGTNEDRCIPSRPWLPLVSVKPDASSTQLFTFRNIYFTKPQFGDVWWFCYWIFIGRTLVWFVFFKFSTCNPPSLHLPTTVLNELVTSVVL